MAQQRGRGSRRGGGYSGRQQQGGRQPGRAAGGRPGAGARNGYGARGGGGEGISGATIALIAALVVGGLVAVVLVILLVARSNAPGPVQPVAMGQPEDNPAPFRSAAAGEVEKPLEPLTTSQIKEIEREIERIAGRESEVRKLNDAGFEAQNRGDNGEAQRCWNEASDILHAMMVEANELFVRVGGEDGEERAERFAPKANRTCGVWSKLRSDISRYVK